MKKVLSLTQKLSAEIEQEISKREEYYETRSEHWQESDAAVDYEEKTDALRDLLEAVADFESLFC